MSLTPKSLTSRIEQLIADGHKKQVASQIVYKEMRAEWKSKHPETKLPVWLSIDSRMKNPVKKYGSRSISPETTEIKVSGKKHSIYDAYPSLAMATKYADDYKKSGQGNAVVRDLSAKAGRLRYALFVTDSFTERFYKGKNPVRPLKSKKVHANLKKRKNNKGLYFVAIVQNGIKYFYTKTDNGTFDSDIKKAASFKNSHIAAIRANSLQMKYNKFINIYFKSS